MEQNLENKVVTPKKRRKWWKIFLYLVLFVLFIPIIISLLLQLKPVQNFAVQQVSEYYSEKFDGDIHIGEVDFSARYGLDLKDFVLTDTQDTIISAASLEIGLADNLTSLIDNSLQLNTVHLSRPRVKIITAKGEHKSNLDVVLDKLVPKKKNNASSQKKEKSGEALDFAVKKISFDDLDVEIRADHKNENSRYKASSGFIDINEINEESIVISTLQLDDPLVNIIKAAKALKKNKKSSSGSLDRLIYVNKIDINNGVFHYDDNTKEKKGYEEFDPSHLNTKVDLELKGLTINGSKYSVTRVSQLSIREKKFDLKNFVGKNIEVSNRRIHLPNFRLTTSNSKIANRLSMKYASFDAFKKFVDEVYFDTEFSNTKIGLEDISFFAPSIKKQGWYKRNYGRPVFINGNASGNVNDLDTKDLDININDEIIIKGQAYLRGITEKNPYLDIQLNQLNTSVDRIKKMMPELGKMQNIDVLGDINFIGKFSGNVNDFKADGKLQTAIGLADLDMELKMSDKPEEATYSGKLNLKDFDIKTFTNNDDYGIVSLNADIKNGKGLTINSLSVDVKGNVEKFDFKNHRYEDFNIDGKLENLAFDGELNLKDPNADFAFDGLVDFKDGNRPRFDFDADINKLSLKDLNLSKDNVEISGFWDIDLTGKNLQTVLGEIKGKSLKVMIKDSLYAFERLDLEVDEVAEGRRLDIKSDAFDLYIKGQYDFQRIVPSIRKLLRDNHIAFLESWPTNDKDISAQKFDIKAEIRDTKNFLSLAGAKDLRLKDFDLKGSLNTESSEISLIGTLPRFKYQGVDITDGKVDIQNIGDRAKVNVLVDSTIVSGATFNPILVSADIHKEKINLHITTEDFNKNLERLDLMATVTKTADGFETQLDNDQLKFLGKVWTFDPDNKVTYKDKYIDIEQLVLSDGERKIHINDIDNKGVAVDLKDFNFETIDRALLGMNDLRFAGGTNINVVASDVFNLKENDLYANVQIAPFYINEQDYGKLNLVVNKAKGNDLVVAKANIEREDYTVDFNGNYNTKTQYLDTEVTTHQFPLKFFKFFIGDGIHDTHGGIDVEGSLKGPIDNLKMNGVAIATGGTTIDYTNGAYHFENQKITVTENYIDFTGSELLDKNNNPGTITGKMHHRFFKDFDLEINISGDDVVVLDTDETINELYYGLGKGSVSADFSGPFHKVNMKIKCETKKGTELSIPIQSGSSDVDKNFIKFIDKDELKDKENNKKFKYRLDGIDIEMDVAMTPDAKINLIFDEQKGDIIKGTGNANLKVYITREGDFNVYGDYRVTQGEYLFTAVGLVAKPFTVRPGGLIRWTGDPFNTTLDITADYTVRAPLNVFLSEYITTDRLRNDANNRTDVNLVLKLGEKLFKPSINFDLSFPDLNGEIASLTNSKMRTLKKNQNELNNQVLGLIVFNSFIPSSFVNDGLSDNALSAGISTVSEFVSSQLSIFVTGIINEALEDNGFISGIDFDIGIKKNSFYGVTSASNGVLPDEIEVNLKNKFRFLDERMSLNLGGNYVREPIIANIQEYFIGDFVLEYYLTNKRNLKVRMYGKYDYDEALADRKMRYGVGLGYNTQFGTVKELKDEIKSDLNKVLKKE